LVDRLSPPLPLKAPESVTWSEGEVRSLPHSPALLISGATRVEGGADARNLDGSRWFSKMDSAALCRKVTRVDCSAGLQFARIGLSSLSSCEIDREPRWPVRAVRTILGGAVILFVATTGAPLFQVQLRLRA
jgi:hypothetical protein